MPGPPSTAGRINAQIGRSRPRPLPPPRPLQAPEHHRAPRATHVRPAALRRSAPPTPRTPPRPPPARAPPRSAAAHPYGFARREPRRCRRVRSPRRPRRRSHPHHTRRPRRRPPRSVARPPRRPLAAVPTTAGRHAVHGQQAQAPAAREQHSLHRPRWRGLGGRPQHGPTPGPAQQQRAGQTHGVRHRRPSPTPRTRDASPVGDGDAPTRRGPLHGPASYASAGRLSGTRHPRAGRAENVGRISARHACPGTSRGRARGRRAPSRTPSRPVVPVSPGATPHASRACPARHPCDTSQRAVPRAEAPPHRRRPHDTTEPAPQPVRPAPVSTGPRRIPPTFRWRREIPWNPPPRPGTRRRVSTPGSASKCPLAQVRGSFRQSEPRPGSAGLRLEHPRVLL